MRTIETDYIIHTCLVAIFSKDLLSKTLFLKGGQAIRVKEKILNRYSADIDFSTPGKISDENAYFELLRETLAGAFHGDGYFLFDFNFKRKPKFKSPNTPDFWSGWGVEFKLIEESKRNLSKAELSRKALIPVRANNPKITFDISEHEYCGSIEKIKVESAFVNVYSTSLLMSEKIRAICQQHPNYLFKGEGIRSRDYYDIERLWAKIISEGDPEEFLQDCAKHLPAVFSAKGVELDLLDKIFSDDFISNQGQGWDSVQRTVAGNLESFEYYVESVRIIVQDIQKRLVK